MGSFSVAITAMPFSQSARCPFHPGRDSFDSGVVCPAIPGCCSHEEATMSTVLACVDFTEATSAVLETSMELARALGASVRLVHVAPPIIEPPYTGDGRAAGWVTWPAAAPSPHRREKDALEALKTTVRNAGLEVDSVIIEGAVAKGVVAEADRVGAKLIILGSHGRLPVVDLLVRSTTNGVARRATCPVVIAPSPRRRASSRPSRAA
jgi:nucleotide-binding universal stress UspA family protein